MKLQRERADELGIAQTLTDLSDVNRLLEFYEEGIKQAKEALEIYERIGNTIDQAQCLSFLARLFVDSEQFNSAEDAATRAINLVSEKGQEFLVCRLHRILGKIHQKRKEREKAIHHFETALGIASPFNWHDELFWIHRRLAYLFHDEDKPESANAHIAQAKLQAVDDPYNLGSAMKTQAKFWHQQGRLEEAKSEALAALEVFEKLGAAKEAADGRRLLQRIEEAMESRSIRVDPNGGGKFLEMILRPPPVDSPSLADGTS